MGDLNPELAHPEVAGWVLGTVDPDDAEWLAGHLPSCPGCRAAVAEFGPTARLLVTAAPADLAPPGLRARTLARVARAASAAPRNLHQATPLGRQGRVHLDGRLPGCRAQADRRPWRARAVRSAQPAWVANQRL